MNSAVYPVTSSLSLVTFYSDEKKKQKKKTWTRYFLTLENINLFLQYVLIYRIGFDGFCFVHSRP